MNAPTPQTQPDNTSPILPPALLLGLAGLGFLIALAVAFTQPTFTVIGWGGLGIAVLSLLAWGLLNPEQLNSLLRGRALAYGGTALLVTGVFLVALVLIYVVVRQQAWRADFSQSENFSLTEPARELIQTISADPSAPQIRIVGFYGTAQGGQRDRAAILLDDVQNASNGRITYKFVDPDREPLVIERYGAQVGQFAVVPLTLEGEPDIENAEILTALGQQLLTDTLVTVSASGDFRAYFLNVSEGVSIADATALGGQVFSEELVNRFKWETQAASLFDLANPQSGIELNDPVADGEVLVIPGGSEAVPDDQLETLTNYLDAGGDMVIFAGINLQGEPALATDPDLNAYLQENFGIRINDDIVFDPFNAVQSVFNLDVHNFGDHPILQGYDPQLDSLLFGAPHSITVSDELPAGVNVTALAQTGEESYTRSGLDLGGELTDADIQPTANSEIGPQTVAVAVENSNTGARLVVFGSDTLMYNQYRQLAGFGIRNSDAARDALFWAAGYDNFLNNIPTLATEARPVDTPLLANDQQLRVMNFIALGALPFGVLALGLFVWWQRRERETV